MEVNLEVNHTDVFFAASNTIQGALFGLLNPEETVCSSGSAGIKEKLCVIKMQNGAKISERYIDRIDGWE